MRRVNTDPWRTVASFTIRTVARGWQRVELLLFPCDHRVVRSFNGTTPGRVRCSECGKAERAT